ncbi:hypothetical protein [Amycolatopsis sp. NPDC004079]|uniref:hypothetical protein n=1 Tax=Amycolatopsis sp. NPDC004079 TaxID=3154549 RepID=UPI0033B21446
MPDQTGNPGPRPKPGQRAADAPYAPHSADPRGRWTVSRLGDGLIEDGGFVLNTDPDPPPWRTPPPPLRRAARKGR